LAAWLDRGRERRWQDAVKIGARGTRKGDFLRGSDDQGGGGDARCDGEATADLRGWEAVGGEQRPGDEAWEPRGGARRLATWYSLPPSSTPATSLKKCYQAV